MSSRLAICGKTLTLAAALTLSWAAAAPAQTATELVSQSTAGAVGNAASYYPLLSAYGDFVVFLSHADNLVPGDNNAQGDVFLRDRHTGVTSLISLNSAGEQGNGQSVPCGVSIQGRYVLFQSEASNLVAADTNGATDIFLRDRATGETTRLSLDSAGGQGDGHSYFASFSEDTRFVAFTSEASNLVAGDTNGVTDVFVRDRQAGETTRVSVDSAGGQANANSYASLISTNGRYVVFESNANNLVTGDTNGVTDVFVHDRATGRTTRASLAWDGAEANAACNNPEISGDGAVVTFSSQASNLAPGDTNGIRDIFVFDRQTGETTRISVSSSGLEANGDSTYPVISANGRWVAFNSLADTLVDGDTNGVQDVFLHDRQTGATTRQSVAADGTQGDAASDYALLSKGGNALGLESQASNFATAPPGVTQVFVRDPVCPEPDMVMYRAYNPYVLGHFFTTRHQEFQAAVAAGYEDESTSHPGQLFRVFRDHFPGLNQAIHRMYNPLSGRHYYTRKDAERDVLAAAGWVYEKDEGYIFLMEATAPQGCGVVQVLYNTEAGCHLFTINAAEAAYVANNLPHWVLQAPLGLAFRNLVAGRLADPDALDLGSSVVQAARALSDGH
ncbi:MAG: hypothetical protein KQJ78_19765 [Deltaproteobacteria bacterium]|nr:hypothetical protein [Deltaproteobacteria bacterium]